MFSAFFKIPENYRKLSAIAAECASAHSAAISDNFRQFSTISDNFEKCRKMCCNTFFGNFIFRPCACPVWDRSILNLARQDKQRQELGRALAQTAPEDYNTREIQKNTKKYDIRKIKNTNEYAKIEKCRTQNTKNTK